MTPSTIVRRAALTSLVAILPMGMVLATPNGTPNTLYTVKDPGCGCCDTWAELAVEAGFEVEVVESDDMAAVKWEAGVPEALWSCHTARIGDYVVEGHVPFAAIRQMLEQSPDINGIAVPGMPAGSPGMGGGVDATVKVTAW